MIIGKIKDVLRPIIIVMMKVNIFFARKKLFNNVIVMSTIVIYTHSIRTPN